MLKLAVAVGVAHAYEGGNQPRESLIAAHAPPGAIRRLCWPRHSAPRPRRRILAVTAPASSSMTSPVRVPSTRAPQSRADDLVARLGPNAYNPILDKPLSSTLNAAEPLSGDGSTRDMKRSNRGALPFGN